MEEPAHQRHVRDPEGHVDEARIDVGDVRVDEHVDRLAGQRGQQRDEQQPQRERAVATGAEGDAGSERHQEDADGGVAGEQQAGGHHDVALGEGRVDEVHPGDGQRGDAGDDRVEGGVEIVRAGGAPAAGQADQREDQQQVAREGQRVGQERTVRAQVAERPELHPGGTTGQEQREGDDLEDPGPGRFRTPAHDAGRGGDQPGHAQHHQGARGVAPQQAQHIGQQEDPARDCCTQCPPGSRPLLLNHVGVCHGRPSPYPECVVSHAPRESACPGADLSGFLQQDVEDGDEQTYPWGGP